MSKLQDEYDAALESYLHNGGETELKRSYDLGRQALAEGRGILDMVAMHEQSLLKLTAERNSQDVIRRAGEFFAESMSPFEMTHRAFGESNSALRRLNETLEEETRKIAHALHDESGQMLAAVYIELQEAMRDLPPNARRRIEKTVALLNQIEQQLRRFSHDLRPTVLDDFGFLPALQSFAGRFSKRAGLPIKIEGNVEKRLPCTVETTLYRIAQEALNNVAKHAKATQVDIHLWEAPTTLHFCIRDNGVGFDPQPANEGRSSGLGLRGMRERLTVLGGTLWIQSAPKKGTELQVSIPMEV
ncbi:MAG TPA: sensor histidine kinase [Candidatus Acidoferrales bacterium]|nr:sensor histidine kinase [Candidatus Acidoferrales bacterium]